MAEATIVRTVGELIAVLNKLDPSSTPVSHEGPFTGVKVVPQEGGNVLLASLWNTDEGRSHRSAKKAAIKG